jgi:hypothetical protein
LKKDYPRIIIDWDYWKDTLAKVRAFQYRNWIENKNWIPWTETLEKLWLLAKWEDKNDFYSHLLKNKDEDGSY